uniref:Reverse transcriptase domain-containing protein n=1 Tax=Cyprinus carpio TaxID=7962 RepID=A0A8C1PP13_CYPCA
MNNNKISLPADIEGISSPEKIAELWREHYCDLFNCVKSNPVRINHEHTDFSADMMVRVADIYVAINMLENNKACGMDYINAEHLKYASHKLCPLLSMCFNGCLVHGVLPNAFMSVLLLPVLKDKAGKLNSIDNYRPIALASILSKVLERILLTKLEMYVLTADNQFGFKRKHGTDLCIYALKEIVSRYNSLNSTMFLCFIDASKAFDRINHERLFVKLLDRGAPTFLVRILVFWYAHQTFQVKWDNVVSAPFYVSNGVRQGGIMSPILFNVYMDELSDQLNRLKTGCLVGNTVVNHLMYADDLVLLCPYSVGLQQMLKVCSQYGFDYDIKYNTKKSHIMVVRSNEDNKSTFPTFYLSDSPLAVCEEVKYLGHVISNDWTDDKDLYRQRCKIYAQANMLIRKFYMCSNSVKCSLFRTYITPLYTAQLWSNYKKKSMQRLKVAYNDAMRLLLRVPRWHSASHLFVSNRVPTCEALLRQLMFGFMCRLDNSVNHIIEALVSPLKSCYRYTSRLRRHWCNSLYIL